ncbi:class I SAM-dependent methyltransferase [Desulforhopalus sp. 52FAK]
MNDKKMTDPRPDWEEKYVSLKISGFYNTPIKKVLSVIDNLIDIFTHPRSVSSVDDIINCANILTNKDKLGTEVTVIGCGPKPKTVTDLASRGYDVLGVEPIDDAVLQAQDYLEGQGKVVKGTAESMPIDDSSQVFVLMENVLEHVDSITYSLEEAYRILKPGGVLFIRTTNRSRFSLTGVNWEFTTRFYNWFPRMVKESYVFSQLHYKPELARYSPRPAVHWFSFPDLCNHGREVGFARFYSPYDLLYLARGQNKSKLLFRLSQWCRKQPWVRAFVVSQLNGDIFMWKRHEED